MTGCQCGECGETVPEAWFCPNCNSVMAVDVLPRTYADVSDMSQQFSELADNAQHKSVSFDSLRSNHESYERPLGTYLREGEQPERIEDIKKCEISGIDDNSMTPNRC